MNLGQCFTVSAKYSDKILHNTLVKSIIFQRCGQKLYLHLLVPVFAKRKEVHSLGSWVDTFYWWFNNNFVLLRWIKSFISVYYLFPGCTLLSIIWFNMLTKLKFYRFLQTTIKAYPTHSSMRAHQIFIFITFYIVTRSDNMYPHFCVFKLEHLTFIMMKNYYILTA